MSPFESFLSGQFEDYIAYRQNLGYDTKSLLWVLRTLDRHLLEKKPALTDLTSAFFLSLKTSLHVQRKSINCLLSTTRMFFNYLVRKDVCQDNPLKDIPLLAEERFIPFVFSPAQIDRLLEALGRSLRREPTYFVKELGIYLAILLLARCGMRIYEPLRLKRHHFRADDNTLYVEKTKFKKDRLIPIPGAVAVEITNYLAVRQSLWGADDNPYLLAASPKKPFYDYLIRPRFHQAVGDIGLSCPRQTIGTTNIGAPTPHSLRHSFAVNTLKRITETGRSPQHALPVLAAYLGHCEYKHTTKYLKLLDASHRHNLVAFIQTQAHRP
jgi:site-specific recombinase XerD